MLRSGFTATWSSRQTLKAEKLVGIGVSDLGAVSVADGAMVEPCLRFNHVLVGIVDGIHHSICTNFENHIGEGLGTEIAACSDVEVLAQIEAKRTLCLEGEAAPAYTIVDAPDAVGNGFAQMAKYDLEFRLFIKEAAAHES